MLKLFRDLVGGLHALTSTLQEGLEWARTVAPGVQAGLEFRERLEALERSRPVWEGEIEAQLQRVEARWDAVRAAENRARHMEKRIRERAAEGDEEGDGDDAIRAYVEAMARADVPRGSENGMHAVPDRLETRADQKAALRRVKLGG